MMRMFCASESHPIIPPYCWHSIFFAEDGDEEGGGSQIPLSIRSGGTAVKPALSSRLRFAAAEGRSHVRSAREPAPASD
ncbi:hypothetical protein X975_14965, partial [Stegodyphus mimosarum]